MDMTFQVRKKKSEVSLKIVHGYEFFGLKQPEYILTSKIESLGCFVVGYSGAFDRDNDVESLILAAKKINNKSEVVFLLVGAGIKVNDYIRMAGRNANIIICDRIPSKDVPSVLSNMDVCYCGLKPKSIYQYGVSLAKSYEYMAASKPIIWMVDACNNPVRNSGGGLTLSPGNIDELSEAIMNLLRMDKNKLAEMGVKNYQYLLEKHSYQVLGRKWDKLVSRFK